MWNKVFIFKLSAYKRDIFQRIIISIDFFPHIAPKRLWWSTYSDGVVPLVLKVNHKSEHDIRHVLRILTTSISVLEWPMLQMMQPFFNRSRCARFTTFLLPAKMKGKEGYDGLNYNWTNQVLLAESSIPSAFNQHIASILTK